MVGIGHGRLDRVDKVLSKLKGKSVERSEIGDYLYSRGFYLEDVLYHSKVEDTFIFRRTNEISVDYVHIVFESISWHSIRITDVWVRKERSAIMIYERGETRGENN